MIDETTNRLQGVNYDANGNQIGDQVYHNYVWNAENRMVQQLTAAGGGSWYGGTSYSYDPSGRRVMKNVNADPAGRNTGSGYGAGTWEFYFYGLNGRKLGTIGCGYDTGYLAGCWVTAQNAYFAGKLIVENGSTVATDRLGSLRANSNPDSSNVKYFPYGAEQTATSEGVTKFATYTRDAVGQDYAEQRYYNAGMGRFWSPDANGGSMAIPGSMNKYAYAGGDPVNLNDPRGLDPYCGPTGVWMGEGCYVTSITGTPGDCWALFGEMGCDSGSSGSSGTGPAIGIGSSGSNGSEDGAPCGGFADGLLADPDPTSCPVDASSGPSSPPTPCGVALGIPALDLPQLAVLMGEDSWSSDQSSQTEDLWMEQSMYNYAVDGGLPETMAGVNSTLNASEYLGMNAGQTYLNNAWNEPVSSGDMSQQSCAHLKAAYEALTEFWNSSKNFSNVNQWRSAAGYGPVGAGATQVGGNAFFYTSGAGGSSKRHRPKPVPVPGKPRRRR